MHGGWRYPPIASWNPRRGLACSPFAELAGGTVVLNEAEARADCSIICFRD
jgi:hypothetical protein